MFCKGRYHRQEVEVYLKKNSANRSKVYKPRTQMTSIFEGQPSKTRPFPIKTRVIWVLGILYHILCNRILKGGGKSGKCPTSEKRSNCWTIQSTHQVEIHILICPNQWLFLVPLKGGIGGIVNPPIGRKNTTYILPSGGLYNPYHRLGEPETTIDLIFHQLPQSYLGILNAYPLPLDIPGPWRTP